MHKNCVDSLVFWRYPIGSAPSTVPRIAKTITTNKRTTQILSDEYILYFLDQILHICHLREHSGKRVCSDLKTMFYIEATRKTKMKSLSGSYILST